MTLRPVTLCLPITLFMSRSFRGQTPRVNPAEDQQFPSPHYPTAQLLLKAPELDSEHERRPWMHEEIDSMLLASRGADSCCCLGYLPGA